MSILSTSSRLIKVGQEYSAGSGISIDDYIISVTGEFGNTYSAGDNIDIYEQDEQLYISSKDWSNDITDASANAFNETTAWVHDNYPNSADVSFLSAEVDKKLYSSAWEAVSGSLATEDYVILSDNLTYSRATAFTTAQEYAKESACNSAFDYLNQNKLDSSSFVPSAYYPSNNPSGFITGVDLSNYYQKNETSSKEEISNAIGSIPVGDPEVNSFVESNSASLTEASNCVETNSGAWFDNVGDEEVNSFVYDNSATINEVNTTYQQNSANYLTAHQSLDGYATTAEVDTLSSILSGAIDYVSANAGDEFPASANEAITAYQTNSSTYLTAISIPDSATWNDVSTTVQTNSADWGQGGGGASYTSPSSTIWISADKIESTDSAYIPSHHEDVLLTATKSWSSMNGYATLANTNKVLFTFQGRGSAFDNEGTFLNSANNRTAWAETEYPPIKLYTNEWTSVEFSAYSAGIMDAYVVELARKNEVNSALNTKLDSSAFRGYYPSNNPSGFAKVSDVVMQSGVNLFDGRVVGINNQYFMGCDSAYNITLVGTSAATGTKTASAYVGTGHQGINIQISARNKGTHFINWTAFSENGSNLSAGQLDFNSTTANRISGFEFNSPLAENISGVKIFGNNMNFTAYSAYTIDVKPLASQDNITFLSGAIDYVSAMLNLRFLR